ncbi:MAG: DNA-processing protein DprA [Bavariicoccus seileri]|uniref:DNA-protecting protein DprA n=1 Tax=Bavariicoccus seileri TaxID=549685 RepID=A0A3D4S5E5_9ENTE|nr:DNA-processing protein DprA [Bavariicoccus seileri]HCS93682.1 DNA-protecting protein DprA [Bavariicoccus seileri]
MIQLNFLILAIHVTKLPIQQKFKLVLSLIKQERSVISWREWRELCYVHHLKTHLNWGLAEEIDQSSTYISIADERYPDFLADIYRPPLILFYEGDPSLLNQQGISLVGSRKMSSYGQRAISHILTQIAKSEDLNQLPIISGLALGVDGWSHRMALKNKLRPIGIIGTGLDVFYPSAHKNLQLDVATKGLLLSEYFPGTSPRKHHFPSRNRIIAGLSSKVIIVEAEEKSGSLITANLALQENRDIFAVPGNMDSGLSVGTNQLIQAGATPLLDVSDLTI